MNAKQRDAIRNDLVKELRARTTEAGGDIADGFVILCVATLDLHAAMSKADGIPLEIAQGTFMDMLTKNYPKAYELVSDAFRRVWQ